MTIIVYSSHVYRIVTFLVPFMRCQKRMNLLQLIEKYKGIRRNLQGNYKTFVFKNLE